MAKGARCYCNHVSEDDRERGRRRWAYSVGAVAKAAGIDTTRVWTDIRRGRVDPGSLGSVARYVARAMLAGGEAAGR